MAIQTSELPVPSFSSERLASKDVLVHKHYEKTVESTDLLSKGDTSAADVYILPTETMFRYIYAVRDDLKIRIEAIERQLEELRQREIELQDEERYIREGMTDLTSVIDSSIRPGSVLGGIMRAQRRLRDVSKRMNAVQEGRIAAQKVKNGLRGELREADQALEVALSTDFHLLEQETAGSQHV